MLSFLFFLLKAPASSEGRPAAGVAADSQAGRVRSDQIIPVDRF